MDLDISGSSMGIISRCFQVLRSSVQSVTCKCRRGGNVQPSHRSSLVQNVQIDPKIKAKTLVKVLAEPGKTVSFSAVKCVLYRHGLKGHSARKKTLLQKKQKKARLQFADGHGHFRDMPCDLMTVKWKCLAIMTSRRKNRGIACIILTKNYVVGPLWCRKNWIS